MHKLAITRTSMNGAGIEKRFTQIISSIGYSEEEQERLKKKFDMSRKIQTIISMQSFDEKLESIPFYLEELRTRHSLLNMIFLRFTLESTSSSDNRLFIRFKEEGGLEIVRASLDSNNKDFLYTLVELICFIAVTHDYKPGMLSVILSKYSLLKVQTIAKYINSTGETECLYESAESSRCSDNKSCICSTFYKRLVDDILGLDKIGDELNFLLRDEKCVKRLISPDYLQKAEDKFQDKNIFKKLLSLSSQENKSEIPFFDEFQRQLDISKRREGEILKIKGMLEKMRDRYLIVEGENRNYIARLEEKEKKIAKYETAVLELSEANSKMTTASQSKIKSLEEQVLNLTLSSKRHSNESVLCSKCSDKGDRPHQTDTLKSKADLFSSNQPGSNEKAGISSSNGLSPLNSNGIKKYDVSSSNDLNHSNSNGNISSRANLVEKVSNLNIVNSNSKISNLEMPDENKSSGSDKCNPVSTETASQPSNSGSVSLQSNPAKTHSAQLEPAKSEPRKSGRFGAKKLNVKKSKFAENKFNGIQWKKSSKSASSIFGGIDWIDFEKSFELADFKSFESAPVKESPVVLQKDKGSVSYCLDPKKNYALNIALGRVRISNSELLDRIYGMSLENENLIHQFILYFPTAEEIQSIRSAKTVLSRAEEFFREAKDLERLYTCLLGMRFANYYRNRDYSRIISEYTELYSTLVESEELKRLFTAMLTIGNILNINTFNGNAEAFSLDSLDAFKCNSKIMALISKKIDKIKLEKEILMKCPDLSVEALVQEMKDIKSFYYENGLDTKVIEHYKKTISRFDEMLNSYKRAQSYFDANDEHFVMKIFNFVKYIK